VCDLASGVGAISIELAKGFPNLRFVLQDMPNRLQQGKTEIWPERCPEALAQNRVQWAPIDLLTESPVRGCDVYYVSSSPYFISSNSEGHSLVETYSVSSSIDDGSNQFLSLFPDTTGRIESLSMFCPT